MRDFPPTLPGSPRPTLPLPTSGHGSAVDLFMNKLTLQARRSFLSLRALLVSLGPDVHEAVEKQEVVYSRAKPFLIARLQRGHLLAVFPDGEALSDPLGRLLRKGRERYVRLDENEDLDAHMQEFARKAYVQAR